MVARMKAAGAIQLGKTNTPTFGWIGATHNLLFGATRNPWNLDRTPGGSSGGASAAVAAGLGPLAIGTDGGGSIRIPASFAGHLRPSSPRSAASRSIRSARRGALSHIGPMTRTVADAALMLNACGRPRRARSGTRCRRTAVDYVGRSRGRRARACAWRGPPIWASREVVDPEVRAACARAARGSASWAAAWTRSRRAGRARRTRGGPSSGRHRRPAGPALPAIDATTSTRAWSRSPTRPSSSGPTQYVQAWFDRLAWNEHPRRLFEKHDLLLTPTIACPPFKVGLDGPGRSRGTATGSLRLDPVHVPVQHDRPAGARRCPAGSRATGCPSGLQILGRRFDDATVLRAAAAFEKIAPWAHLRPM